MIGEMGGERRGGGSPGSVRISSRSAARALSSASSAARCAAASRARAALRSAAARIASSSCCAADASDRAQTLQNALEHSRAFSSVLRNAAARARVTLRSSAATFSRFRSTARSSAVLPSCRTCKRSISLGCMAHHDSAQSPTARNTHAPASSPARPRPPPAAPPPPPGDRSQQHSAAACFRTARAPRRRSAQSAAPRLKLRGLVGRHADAKPTTGARPTQAALHSCFVLRCRWRPRSGGAELTLSLASRSARAWMSRRTSSAFPPIAAVWRSVVAIALHGYRFPLRSARRGCRVTLVPRHSLAALSPTRPAHRAPAALPALARRAVAREPRRQRPCLVLPRDPDLKR